MVGDPASFARLDQWPLRSFGTRFEAEEVGEEAVWGTDDRWYVLRRGFAFPFRAVPVVMDEHDRLLVGVRLRVGSATEGRLSFPGDDEFVPMDQGFFHAAAAVLLDVDWPFGRGDRSLLARGLADCLHQQPMPTTFDLDLVSRVAVFCLPFVFLGRDLSEVERRIENDAWGGRVLLWAEARAVYAAMKGDLRLVQRLFDPRGLQVAQGFRPDLLAPLRQQLGA